VLPPSYSYDVPQNFLVLLLFCFLQFPRTRTSSCLPLPIFFVFPNYNAVFCYLLFSTIFCLWRTSLLLYPLPLLHFLSSRFPALLATLFFKLTFSILLYVAPLRFPMNEVPTHLLICFHSCWQTLPSLFFSFRQVISFLFFDSLLCLFSSALILFISLCAFVPTFLIFRLPPVMTFLFPVPTILFFFLPRVCLYCFFCCPILSFDELVSSPYVVSRFYFPHG